MEKMRIINRGINLFLIVAFVVCGVMLLIPHLPGNENPPPTPDYLNQYMEDLLFERIRPYNRDDIHHYWGNPDNIESKTNTEIYSFPNVPYTFTLQFSTNGTLLSLTLEPINTP